MGKRIKTFFTNFFKLFKDKNILTIIMACFSYSSICLMGIIETYNPFSWLIFGIICLLFYKTNIQEKKYRKEIIIMSIIYSILLIFGKIVYTFQFNKTANVFSIFFSFKTFIKLLGTFNFIFILLMNIYPKIYNFKLNKKNSFTNKKIFWGSFIFIFICWLPYFLKYYPGVLTPDSLSEIDIIFNNFSHISDHHPIIHTLFISLPFNIGYKIFHSANLGVTLYSLIQMIIMDLIFSYFLTFLNERKVNKKILILTILFYAIMPVHPIYSISMWKDVIFSGLILLLSIETLKLLENKNINFKSMISFIIISILCIFFRNNGVYMYLLLIIFSLIIFKDKRKIFIIAFTIVLGTYAFVKGPVFTHFGVEKTESAEYIGMPLQQIGRMAFKNIEFTEYEKKEINKLIPIEILKDAYNPQFSDGIKFNPNYKDEVFDNNKFKYFKIWLNLVIKHPSIALEAHANSTLGYWYPGVSYSCFSTSLYPNDFGIYRDQKLPSIFDTYFKYVGTKKIPILNMVWSIGLCFWIIFLFGYITLKKKGFKYLYVFIPVIGVWITMLIASPVFAEFRYIYCAYITLPLLLLMPYLDKNNKKDRRKYEK